MRCIGPTPARRVGLALLATAPMLALAAAVATPAAAAAPARVTLPSPNTYDIPGTPAALDPGQEITLRVYLAGQHPAGLPAAAAAAATPGGPAYARYLTAAQYAQQFGPTAAQVAAVTGWLTSQGMTVTATTAHYLAVQATVAEVDGAFDTQVSQYVATTTADGYTFTSAQVGVVGGFSVPAALGNDITTITGFEQRAQLSESDCAALWVADAPCPVPAFGLSIPVFFATTYAWVLWIAVPLLVLPLRRLQRRDQSAPEGHRLTTSAGWPPGRAAGWAS